MIHIHTLCKRIKTVQPKRVLRFFIFIIDENMNTNHNVESSRMYQALCFRSDDYKISMSQPFANWLIRVRESRGLSQNALAQKASVDPSLLSKYEKVVNAPKPRRVTIKKIVNALGLSPEEEERGMMAAGFIPESEGNGHSEILQVTDPKIVQLVRDYQVLAENEQDLVSGVVSAMGGNKRRVPILNMQNEANQQEVTTSESSSCGNSG